MVFSILERLVYNNKEIGEATTKGGKGGKQTHRSAIRKDVEKVR